MNPLGACFLLLTGNQVHRAGGGWRFISWLPPRVKLVRVPSTILRSSTTRAAGGTPLRGPRSARSGWPPRRTRNQLRAASLKGRAGGVRRERGRGRGAGAALLGARRPLAAATGAGARPPARVAVLPSGALHAVTTVAALTVTRTPLPCRAAAGGPYRVHGRHVCRRQGHGWCALPPPALQQRDRRAGREPVRAGFPRSAPATHDSPRPALPAPAQACVLRVWPSSACSRAEPLGTR